VTFARYRCFETYAWMHFLQGRECERQAKKTRAFYGVFEPSWNDVVIPQYLDLDDYPFMPVKASPPYAIHLGRNIALKGLAVAAHACRMAGMPLYVAGQAHEESEDWTNLGVLSIEERARWVGGASCLIAPTLYMEPGGTVTLEAAAYGTPVVTTDFGCFSETVLHGETGWRCRTFNEFSWAVAHAHEINPFRCREVAEQRWSLEKVGAMYEHWFRSIAAQEAGGEAPVRDLDWLRRDS
jgi:glycosyltransferase involved in cell wall biosynthesis